MVAQYYENNTDGHKKFWKITYNKDFSITVNWGRIGATGTTKTFPFSSKSEQKQFGEKKTMEKIEKGYVKGKMTMSKKAPMTKTPAKSKVKVEDKATGKAKKATQSKKNIKNKNKAKTKTKPTKKKLVIDKYDEEWASEPDRYIEDRAPTKAELMKRRKIIDDIYRIYKQIKKIDEDSDGAIDPQTWRDPPEYCGKDMLLGMHQLINESLNKLKDNKVKKDKAFKAIKNKAELKKNKIEEFVKKVTKKTPAKKMPSKKTPAKKMPSKKTPAKKMPPKKTPAKKMPSKKTPAKKMPSKKTTAKKIVVVKAKPQKVTMKEVPKSKMKIPSNMCASTGYKVAWDVKKQGVMLAHTFKDAKTGKIKSAPKGSTQAPNGWYLSEKFDGYRAIWDGKTFRSRAGNIFATPKWFKAWMPPGIVLDGELFMGRECFEECGIFRKKTPNDKEWKSANVKYHVFDCPSHKGLFEERQKYMKDLVKLRCLCSKSSLGIPVNMKCPIVFTNQTKVKNEADVMKKFESLVKKGAEGVMLRAPASPYEPKRSSYLLKVKQSFDAECRIIGYKPGTGKYAGMLGAFHCELVKDKSIKFDISGMNDKIRKNYKKTHPLGTIVTFTYMGLSSKGVPRHPVYFRIRKGKE